jgi:lysophospholipase L1-like esterase
MISWSAFVRGLAVVASCAAVGTGAEGAPARYLALGDSYTIGEGVAEDARWPVRLAAALNAGDVPCGAPRIIARTGWTTDEMLAAVDGAFPPDAPAPVFDLVTVLIGVNDQFRGRPPEAFTRSFPICLARAVGLAGGRRDHVVVVAIPDYGCTPFAERLDAGLRARVHDGIDAFDAIARAQSAAPIGYADILPVSRTVVDHPDWVAGDGLHPSPAQYAAWVEVILPAARAALTAGPATAAAPATAAGSATAAAR